MSDTEEEVVVTIDNAADGVVEDPAKALAQQYQELKADTERERAARQAAEQRENAARIEAERARREVTAARADVVDSQYDTVATGLEAAKAEASQAEQEYVAAFDRGDSKEMARAQRKMAQAEARAVRLEEAKVDLEVRRKAPEVERRPEPAPQRQQAADPVEAYTEGRTEPTKKWLREHPDWITDPRKNAKLTAAHYAAISEGLKPDTAEYFDHVETFTGIKTAKSNGQSNGQARPRAAAPAAPVYSAGGGTNGGGREVRLSAGEAKAATDGTHVWNYDDTSPQKRFRKGDPIGVQEFARRKEALTKQGAYDRSYVEQ